MNDDPDDNIIIDQASVRLLNLDFSSAESLSILEGLSGTAVGYLQIVGLGQIEAEAQLVSGP